MKPIWALKSKKAIQRRLEAMQKQTPHENHRKYGRSWEWDEQYALKELGQKSTPWRLDENS